MTGDILNKILGLNCKHALYRSDGKWYHDLKDFPSALFDDNGYVIFTSKEQYQNHRLLQHKADLHIIGGISNLVEYTYYSSIQLDILEQSNFYQNYAELVYSPNDIVWFKSVTNEEIGEAYMNEKNTFPLNFPTKFKENAKSPKCGEIIVLYQKVFGVPALTHLVTPIDSNIKDQNIRDKYRYTRQVKIIAQTTTNDLIKVSNTSFDKIKKGGITNGNVCKLEKVSGIQNISEIQANTWQMFIPYFNSTHKRGVSLTQQILNELESDPVSCVEEGKLQLVSHYIKERNKKIVLEKKRQAIKENNLKCEACNFSFQNTFGADFIECHHLMPISSTGQRITTLDDLALVCANCHRMLHSKFNGGYLTLDELRSLIKKNTMIDDYSPAYKYFSKPPNVENTYLPHPIYSNKAIELGIFNEHRFAFYFWAKWRISNNNKTAPALITFDWHQDLAYPDEIEKEWLSKLDLKNQFEVSFYSWAKLNPLNDNHILSAAFLDLIGDIYVVCKDFSCGILDEIEEIRDINNKVHLVRKFDSHLNLLNTLKDSNLDEILFDIDLDYFTVENISSNDKQYFSYMSDKSIKGLFNPNNPLMQWILKRISGFSIALEPEHCGSIQKSMKYLSLLESILFTGSIFNNKTKWK